MAGYNSLKCHLMMVAAYKNIIDHDNMTREEQQKNGKYIIAHFEEWLDEFERLSEFLLIYPDEEDGAELASMCNFITYMCACNGALQHGYLFYLLGKDIVQRYGRVQEYMGIVEYGEFCPEHFKTTPVSYDKLFFNFMVKRAERFSVKLYNAVDSQYHVKEKYSYGIEMLLGEWIRVASIFRKYTEQKDMTRYASGFYTYLSDIYLYLGNVFYSVYGYNVRCDEILVEGIRFAERGLIRNKVLIGEQNRAWLQSLGGSR